MRASCEKGLTLIELVLAITITGIIASAGTALLWTCLEVQAHGEGRSRLYQEGLMLMERMTHNTRNANVVQIPNNHKPTRDMLAVSTQINSDGDSYFGDPLFPRVDEDYADKLMWSGYGIYGIDDDGDGAMDDGSWADDDEDGTKDEEIFDGLDNDGDGNIDEDLGLDFNQDGATGIRGMDDDGDGLIDEMTNPNPLADEDEDGPKIDENVSFFLYTYDSGTNTLREILPNVSAGVYNPDYSEILSTRVTGFTTTYYPPDATNHPKISISLTLTGDDGQSIQFVEYVYPRNVLQKTGKKVR